ncbi:MAG TPA: glycosyltransferase [Lichenihabitans sp.]|nr:glycosyltransferase [Lichenihabitans sp.]
MAAIRASHPQAEIEAVLPRQGPIVAALAGLADIRIEPLLILRRRGLRRIAATAPVALPAALMRARARFARSDLVYINTSVVADHLLMARFFPHRAIVHVHEIPEGRILQGLRALLLWSGATIVFNSRATREAFALPPERPSHVIYNGVAGPAAPEPTTYDGTRPLRVLMLGRISRIKGQEVMVEALCRLPWEMAERIELRIVGNAFEDAGREAALAAFVAERGLDRHVRLSAFVDDPASLFRWADVVAVPSRLPESLGRVAIEAMAFGRPVVASAIGGLKEVVEDGRTGWLVRPDDPAALATTLAEVVRNPAAWRDLGAAARQRYEAMFSPAATRGQMAAVMAPILARCGDPAGPRSTASVEMGRP